MRQTHEVWDSYVTGELAKEEMVKKASAELKEEQATTEESEVKEEDKMFDNQMDCLDQLATHLVDQDL